MYQDTFNTLVHVSCQMIAMGYRLRALYLSTHESPAGCARNFNMSLCVRKAGKYTFECWREYTLYWRDVSLARVLNKQYDNSVLRGWANFKGVQTVALSTGSSGSGKAKENHAAFHTLLEHV